MAHVLCEVELLVGLYCEGPHCVGVQDEALFSHVHDILEGVFGVGVRSAVVEHFLCCALEENKLLGSFLLLFERSSAIMFDGHLVLINLLRPLLLLTFLTAFQHFRPVLNCHQHCQLGHFSLEPDDLPDLQTVIERLELVLLGVPALAELEDLLLEH